jgi:SAM-dependent methyltransferase
MEIFGQMSGKKTWSQSDISAELARTSFGYQKIALPFGLSTDGDDRSATAEAIFDEKMDGKSVFDLGCRFGFFCFFAEGRGASKIVGAEVDPDFVRKSKLLAEMRNSKTEFILYDIEEEAINERFDYVLCLNVLHHLRNPLSALDTLIAAAREKLIIETAGFTRRDRRKNGISLWKVPILSRLPIMLLARNSSQTFFLTVEALKVLLLEKRADIAKVDVVYAGHKGRPVVIAHRRRIKRMLVIAGLPAVGKSTLIEHLLSQPDSPIARKIQFDGSQTWTSYNFGKIKECRDADMGNVIVHYNISGRMMNSDIYKYASALPELMSVADEVNIVTVTCPTERLIKQFEEGRMPKAKGFAAKKSIKKKMKKLLELYKNNDALAATFNEWGATTRRWGKEHIVVFHDGSEYSLSQLNETRGG